MQPFKHLGVFLLWNLAISAALLAMPPALGLVSVLLLSGLLLWGYFLRPGRLRRWALLRLRPLRGDALRWTLAAVPVLLVLSWALGEVYMRLVPVPSETLNAFGPLLERPLGRLSLALLAVGVAPVLEEFFFRGLIQRSLERRRGAPAGIALAAALFAAVHVLPWVFPLHFFLGLAFGFAVYATRSIWAGVVLHAANNTAALVGLGVSGDEVSPVPTLWEAGTSTEWWTSLAALVLAAAAAAWIGRRLWQAGRQDRLRYA